MPRSGPSYAPAAAAWETNDDGSLQDAIGTMACQHEPHTGPAVGCSSSVPHAAHDGARTTERSASRADLKVCATYGLSGGRDVDHLGVAPEPLEPVETAGFRREDVDDEVEVVEE